MNQKSIAHNHLAINLLNLKDCISTGISLVAQGVGAFTETFSSMASTVTRTTFRTPEACSREEGPDDAKRERLTAHERPSSRWASHGTQSFSKDSQQERETLRNAMPCARQNARNRSLCTHRTRDPSCSRSRRNDIRPGPSTASGSAGPRPTCCTARPRAAACAPCPATTAPVGSSPARPPPPTRPTTAAGGGSSGADCSAPARACPASSARRSAAAPRVSDHCFTSATPPSPI